MILTRELRRNPRPFIVPTGVLTLLAVLLLYPSAVLDGILHGSTGVLRTAPADLIVYAREANGVLILSSLDGEERALVEGVEGVDRVAAFDAWLLGAIKEGEEQTAAVALLSSETQLGPEAPGPGEALVDETLKEQVAVSEGDTLVVGPAEVPVTVTGFVSELNLWLLPGVVVDKDTWTAALDPGLSAETAGGGDVPDETLEEPSEDMEAQPGDQPGEEGESSGDDEAPESEGTGDEGDAGEAEEEESGAEGSGTESGDEQPPESPGSDGAQETAGRPVRFAGQDGGAVQEPGSAGAPGGIVDDGTSQLLFVDLADGADPEAVAAAIDEATDRETETFTRSGAVQAMPGVEEQETTFGYIRWVTLTVALVVVGLFLMFLTLERTPFYAVLKAVGASSRQLFVGVVIQALLITAVAVGLGTAVTWGLTHIPFELPTMMQPVRLVETLVALGGTTVIGSILSLRRVTGIDPADAIG